VTPAAIAVASLVGFGLAAAAWMAWAQRRLLRRGLPPVPAILPPISVLKPMKGMDADLEANLESVFAQDYPDFEVVLGTEDANDPALDVARRVAARHPERRSTVVSGAPTIGWNPKVNNLAHLARQARHEFVLISDSNIRVEPTYLKVLAAYQSGSNAGLVWSIFRGSGGRGLGGALETLQLNVFVCGGIAVWIGILGRTGAVGKSMLLRKTDLVEIGGFEYLGRFLAEDQVCAEELTARGRPVVLSTQFVDNVLGPRSLRDFAGRHLRWARLRRHVSLVGYLGEFLLNPVFLSLIGAAALRTPASLLIAGSALVWMSLVDLVAERALGLRRPVWHYPFLELALGLLRGLLWIVPLFSRRVVWRGRTLRIGRRSEIAGPPPAETALAR
jgi:ceramide glucosyltransferase